MDSAQPSKAIRSQLRMKHLEFVVALAVQSSIHRVSRELNMSQPAGSKLLRDIERAFGVTLFERSRHGVVPNAFGKIVVERARLILGILDGTFDTLTAISGGLLGSVSVGVTAVAAPVLVPRVLEALRRRDSRLRVGIEEGSAEALLGSLRQGKCDCVLGRAPETNESDDLLVEPLYDEPIVVAAGERHPLAHKRRVDWANALKFEWILPPPGAPTRRVLASTLARMRLPMPRSLFESVSILANVAAIEKSNSLALLPSGIAEHYAGLKQLWILPLRLDSTLSPVCVISRIGEPMTAALAAFFETLREVTRPS
jgi:DNA-binding transcriptional LysR family regulator